MAENGEDTTQALQETNDTTEVASKQETQEPAAPTTEEPKAEETTGAEAPPTETQDSPKQTEGATPPETEDKPPTEPQPEAGATPAEDKKDDAEGAKTEDKPADGATPAEAPVKSKPTKTVLELVLPEPKEGDRLVIVSRYTTSILGKKTVRGIGAFRDDNFRFFGKIGDYTAQRSKPTLVVPYSGLEEVIKRADYKPPKPIVWPQSEEAASVVLRIGGKPNYFFFDSEEIAGQYIEELTTKQKELYTAPTPKQPKKRASVKEAGTKDNKKPAEGAANETPKEDQAAAEAPKEDQAAAEAPKEDKAAAEAPKEDSPAAEATKEDQATTEATEAT